MPSSVEKITKEELNTILKDIYNEVDHLGASSVRYWVVRHMKGEADGSKQAEYIVHDYVIEKVIGSAVQSGKYIYVKRDQQPYYDFSIQRNPNAGLNRTLKISNILMVIILAIISCFIGYQALREVQPKPEPISKAIPKQAAIPVTRTSDTTNAVTSLSERVVTAYLENTKKEVAAITRFSPGGNDSVYYLLFLDGRHDSYGTKYDAFNFDSRKKMKYFISFLVDSQKKHDLSERVHMKSDDGKNLTVVWLGKDLVVYVNHSVYMKCLPATLKTLNVL